MYETRRNTSVWPQIIAIVMLAWALVPTNPYGYYMLLRVVVCGVCAYSAYKAATLNREGWTWLLGVVAVLYNPIMRIHLTREIWFVINIVTITMMIVSIFTLPGSNRNDGNGSERV